MLGQAIPISLTWGGQASLGIVLLWASWRLLQCPAWDLWVAIGDQGNSLPCCSSGPEGPAQIALLPPSTDLLLCVVLCSVFFTVKSRAWEE